MTFRRASSDGVAVCGPSNPGAGPSSLEMEAATVKHRWERMDRARVFLKIAGGYPIVLRVQRG